MKKYCIVSFGNLYVLPYSKTYINEILASGAQCDLLFWDRDAVNGQNDNYDGCRKICYERKITPESSFKEKLFGYIEARSCFCKQLKKEKYDGVIFLQTHSAVACENVLKKHYKGRYIVDIRDFTLENYWIYRIFEKKVVDNSFATAISSPAYRKFLPEHDYVMAHNYTPFEEDILTDIRSRMRDSETPINISFVGTVRFIDMDKKILNLFANDTRFKINYYGTGSHVLERYCKENNINNTEFYGSFSPDMTTNFYKNTDLINNLYGNHNHYLDYALSNKIYHTAQFYMPILVCPETYMEEVATEYQMGFVLDVNDADAPDKLFDQYKNNDVDKLAEGCNKFLAKVKEENIVFYNTIRKFINDFS